MVFSLTHVPLSSFSIREAVKVIINDEIKTYDTKRTACKELKSWVGWIRLNYLDDNARKPFDMWANQRVTLGHANVTSSPSESVNSMLNKSVKKNACLVNKVRGMRDVVKQCFRNFRNAKQNGGITKKISRKRVAKSILLARIFAEIEALEPKLVTDDMILMDDAIAKLRSLLLLISKTESAAEKLVSKNDNDENPLIIENLVRFHLQLFPEDVNYLYAYVKT